MIKEKASEAFIKGHHFQIFVFMLCFVLKEFNRFVNQLEKLFNLIYMNGDIM